MKKASDKAYISKRLIEKYQKEKEKQMNGILESIKEVKEDEQMQESLALKQENLDLLGMGDGKMKAQNQNNKGAEGLFVSMDGNEEDDDDCHSAESLDSDDLEDDLEAPSKNMLLGQIQMQQQQMQPPASLYNPQNNMIMDFEMSNNNNNNNPYLNQPPQAFGSLGGQNNSFQPNPFGQQERFRNISSSHNFQPPQPQYGFQQQQLPQLQHQQQQQQQQPQQKKGFFGSLFGMGSSVPQQNQRQLNSVPQQPAGGLFGMNAQNPQNMMPPPMGLPKPQKERRNKYRQEVDTNVFQVTMACLKDQGELATGDPVFCKQCDAIFNTYSKIEDSKQMDEEQIWQCEYCNHKNKVELEPEEIPKSDAVNYILEAAAQIHDKQKKTTPTDVSVVFCIDISGSMCVTQPIAGSHAIKGDRMRSMKADLMKFSDGSDQRLQGDHGITYVSRLQCVQSAIDSQLENMKKTYPERKIGLVTFNNEVTIIGDGTKQPQTITGDKLHNYDYLLKNGIHQSGQLFQKSIKDTKSKLSDKLMSLEETGPTALGPAILTAIALAGEGQAGSTVIVCTDGLANVGLGSFDEVFSEEQSKKVDEYYEMIGQYAKSKGVTVNIVSIEGEECNIDTISKISELTGGEVQRVNPKDLIENFSNILSLPVIATNVQLKVKIHKAIEFRNEEPQNLSSDKTILARDLGNVNEETEIFFEYKIKSVKELVKMTDIDITQMSYFPFQAQITYTALDGSRCVRVITNRVETSNDKQELEKKADYEMLSVNAIQQSAKVARGGDIQRAQVISKAWNNHMMKNAQTDNQMMHVQQYQESANGMYNLMSVQKKDNIQRSAPMQMMGAPQQQQQKQALSYQPKMNDEVSSNLYRNSRINTKAFQNKKK